jgi:hypothetical protein
VCPINDNKVFTSGLENFPLLVSRRQNHGNQTIVFGVKEFVVYLLYLVLLLTSKNLIHTGITICPLMGKYHFKNYNYNVRFRFNFLF